jgi:carboxypeptidase T
MKQMNRERTTVLWRLFMPALLALLPMLLISGGFAGSVSAGAKPASVQTQSSTSQPQREEVLVLRVYFRDNAERDYLATTLGAEEVPTTNGYLTVLTDRETYNNLVARGNRVEIDEEQTARLNDPILNETFYGGYKTVEEIYTFLDQQVAAHPTLAAKVDIGDSWCKTHAGQCTYPQPNNGYDLFVMHITNQAITGTKPVFWVDAGIHSREIATPEVAMRYISYLLDNYNTNADVRWLVDYHDIWVMPTYNPDGHHIVEAGGDSPYLYRKNGNNTAGSCSIPPTGNNHYGVDDNRNFPFKWGCCGGSTGAPCAQTYRGVSAGSEDETIAVTAKIRQLIPDQRGPLDTDVAPITTTGIYQNLHTVVPVNLYPWGWTKNPAPNAADLRNIGAHMAAPSTGGNGYPYCTIPDCLYIVDGGSIDWAYGELGAAAMSTELSGGDFLPPYSCIDNPGCDTSVGIWPENRGMLLYMAKIARTPYLLTRGPDANMATTPFTVTLGSQFNLTSTVNYAWEENNYAQNVAAAQYYLDVPQWAGGTGVPMTAQDGAFDEQTEPVQATINTTGMTLGRHIIFVRGRGVNDYQGFQSWGPVSAIFLDVVDAGSITPSPTSPAATPTSAPTIAPSITPVPPTATSAPPTATSGLPTSTVAATNTAGATATSVAATPSPCTITFSDVPSTNTFYADIRCLACQGIIGGYSDGTFRPNNEITRGQLSKIVANSAKFNEPVAAQTFEDVAPDNTFYLYIGRMASRGIIGGYPCGGGGEPCGTTNRPYFRPNANATRGQISKIVSEAAGFDDIPEGQTYQDVPPENTFYVWIERLSSRGIMSGYPCGGTGEPCGTTGKPYFRPNNNATRGQTSKIVSGAFFPDCQAR